MIECLCALPLAFPARQRSAREAFYTSSHSPGWDVEQEQQEEKKGLCSALQRAQHFVFQPNHNQPQPDSNTPE